MRPGALPVVRLLLIAIASLVLSPTARAAPAKLDQLVVRMWPGPWGDSLAATVSKAFTERTGIPVVFDPRDDGAMSTIVQSALAQGRQPPIDVFYTLATAAIKDEARGLMDEIRPDEIPNLAFMLPRAKPAPADGKWHYINVGIDIMTLVYRKAKFPDGPPTSLQVLFEPRFKGRTFLYVHSEGCIGPVALANGWRIPDDMERIWSFLETRVKPLDPIIGGDPDLVGAFQRDEVDVAMTYPAVARDTGDGAVTWTRAREGTLGTVESVWLPRGLPEANRYWATRFIDTLLAPEVLAAYCGRLVIPCFRQDMALPPGAAEDPAFPKTADDMAQIATLPLEAYAAHQAEWDARADEILK
jgi:putative spermidine/putrescine transport system substrate-binding protein